MRFFVSFGAIILFTVIIGCLVMIEIAMLNGGEDLLNTFSNGFLIGILVITGVNRLGDGFWIGKKTKD